MAPTRKYLKTQAIGVLLRNKFKIVWIAAKAAIGIETQIGEFVDEAGVDRTPIPQPRTNDQRLADCIAAAGSPATSPDDRRSLAYKGRPLNGIWATAPYLHNGSVRTLYDLLLPPAQRPPRFWVGNREFDVDKVGFVNEESDIGSWFSTKNPDGSDIIGSSNLGHDYGNARLGKAERQALVAYMKTL